MERRVPAAAVGPRGLRDKVAMVRFPVVMVVTVAWAGMPRWRDRAWPVARVVMVGMGVLTAMAVLVAPGAAVGSVWMALMVPCSVRRARMVVPVGRGVVLEVVARVRVLMVVGVMVARVVRAGLAVLVVPGMTRPWMGMGVGAVMPVPVVMVARGVLGV